MYYEPSTQTIFGNLAEFRASHPLTSFGQLASEVDRNAAGLFELVQQPPTYDTDLQEATLTGAQQVGETWYATYTVTDKPLTPEQREQVIVSRYESALDAHLDSVAKTRRWDSRFTCALRAGYVGPFQAEGQAFAAWMDVCNAFAYSYMAEVLAGTKQMPASTAAFIALLPPMVWPE